MWLCAHSGHEHLGPPGVWAWVCLAKHVLIAPMRFKLGKPSVWQPFVMEMADFKSFCCVDSVLETFSRNNISCAEFYAEIFNMNGVVAQKQR